MTNINYQALREKAEKATWGDWDSYKPHRGARGYKVRLSGQAIAQHVLKNNAEFIAAFNPKVALALLDERERNQQYIKRRDQENEDIALTVGKLRVELEETKSKLNEQREYYEGVISDGSKRIAELEKSEEQLINERDHAESALADMYFAAPGDRPEWSNWFGFSDAVDAVVDRIADLEAKQPAPVVPEEKPMPNPLSMYAVDAVAAIAEVRGWNACRAAMLQSGNFRENKNSSTNNFREIAETSTNYPAIPSEVLSAILKVARIRADFDDFDGDRRGIGDCLDEAEQELIVTINKYASQLAAEPIAPNDVREQTAIPQVPVTPDGWISCSERMPDDRQEVNQ